MFTQSTLYLSNDGNDLCDGFSPSTAVKSFSRINQILGEEHLPVTVKIMGDYFLDETALVTRNSVTFEPYQKRARLIGGKKLVGWQKDRFNGVDCYSLYIPEVKKGEWTPTDLFVNGERAALCRYPKEGTLQAQTTQYPNDTDLMRSNEWFIAKKSDLASLTGVEDAIVSFNHFWIDEHTPVQSYDQETGKIVFAFRSRFAITPMYDKNEDSASGMCYYFENLPCAFTDENDWYLDKKTGKIYYIPPRNASISSLEIFAPTLSALVKVNGEKDNKLTGVRFRDIEFICSKGDFESRSYDTVAYLAKTEKSFAGDAQAVFSAPGAVIFSHANSCYIQSCKFYALGLHAVEIRKGCVSVTVEDCSFTHLGGGAIKIYGTTDISAFFDDTKNNIIKNNLIRDCGQRYTASCGILVMDSPYNIIEGNEICYLGYTGVSVGWVWGYSRSVTLGTLIKNNHIHHIGRGTLSDMGGIYMLGEQTGAVVTGNLIHDIDGACYGAWGIYNDAGSNGITIENNIVYNCKSQCYHQNYGKNNIIKNNIFAFGGTSVVYMTRREEHLGIMLEGNTLIARGTPIYGWHLCFGETPPPSLYTKNNTVFDIQNHQPVLCKIKDKEYSLEEWQSSFHKDDGTTVALPDFIETDGKTLTVK